MKKTIVIAAMAGIMAVAGTGITTNMVMAQENEKSAVIYDSEDTTISGDTQYGYTDTDWEFAFNSSDKNSCIQLLEISIQILIFTLIGVAWYMEP